MAKYRVEHVVICEVNVWRVIEADNYTEAMGKVSSIQTITSTSEGADYEIITDMEIKEILIRREEV